MSAIRSSFGDLLEPGFRKIFDDNFKEYSEQYSQIFKVVTSSKQDEKDSAVTGFGLMEEHTESQPLVYDDVQQGYDVTYTHKTFRRGFSISKEMYEDDQYNVMKKKPAALAKSARRTIEYYASAVLNGAFSLSYLGGDGEPLCSVGHPCAVGAGGASQSNASSTSVALSEPNLRAAILAMRGQKDDKGMKIQIRPTHLIVPPALEHTAKVLLQTTLIPGSANNDVNTLKGELTLIVYDWLTSETVWFLMDKNQAELNFFWRVRPEFKQEENFDTDAALYKARMRFSCGFSDWRGIWGSQGNAAGYSY